ncbi:MAG: B12-binding domain-containing radical SAM protein [Methylocystis sp.]|uniref:B12-binding domain-containing radical SAM protein n=1 Tax=Methylocystis sp. TaxID=1911079 RepID=UPI003D116188
MSAAPTKVLLVFPLFNRNSFWSFEAACKAVGARCPAPPLGLLTVAALLPQTWEFKLVDRNAEPLEEKDIVWADLVMTGGMLPQRLDALAIIERCKSLGRPVCVGGPDATSSPDAYRSADFLVLGEAEGIIDEFVSAWRSGDRRGVFEAEKFQADVTRSPLPRYDLLTFAHYLFIGVQFSRGCPFNCEFCDIIELYGQTPRSKTNEQMIAHLDRLYALGYRGHVDFVDDNLIGNKKALKLFLPILKAWQQKRGYPFKFSTEASINLADDAQLLTMMREANFFVIFVGVESPDADTLLSMQKKQNMRRSLEESIFKIYAAGIFVLAGFIVGFDSEGDGVADGMIDCIRATSLPIAMVGLLTALPNTQLTRRLATEGRLAADFDAPLPERGDQCTAGLNFAPLRPRREILKDYRDVLDSIYTPDAFFGRLATVGRALRRPTVSAPSDFRALARDVTFLFRLSWWMTINRPKVAARFWPLFLSCARNNPSALECVVLMTGLYLHVGPFALRVVGDLDRQIAALDQGDQMAATLTRQATLA